MAATSTDMSPSHVSVPTHDRAGAPGPALVLLLDVDQLSSVDCSHPAGGLYSEIWVFALRRGQPLGMVEFEVRSPTIEAEELRASLRKELGQAWSLDLIRESSDVTLPRATVVVPTNVGRPQQLLECVARLSELDYPDYEVIVVDNRRSHAPGEDVLASVRGLPRVRVLAERRPGISAARNRGAAAATGEIIAFTDDDVEVDQGWLRALGRRFVEEPQTDAVTGLLVPKELETPAQIWLEQSGSWRDRVYVRLSFELAARGRSGVGALSPARFRLIRSSPQEGGESIGSLYATGEFANGANMAFRRGVLESLGGFDEALGAGTPTCGGEDLVILIDLLAAGRRVAYEPAAIVHHTNRRSLEDLERQIHGYGIGLTAMLTALIWRDPRHLAGLIGMVPAAFRSILSSSSVKQSSRGADYPSQLVRADLLGMLGGPLAYARSRRAQRRWRG
jgi:GT2 family glycosyltransferase